MVQAVKRRSLYRPVITLGLVAVFGVACETTPLEPSTGRAVDAALAGHTEGTQDRIEAVPPHVQEALLPPLQLGGGGEGQPTEARFDVSADRAPARQVFLSLVEGTPYEMVVAPDVKGRLTLDLKNVTLEEALETIREMYGYNYRRRGQRYFVSGGGLQTRLFQVNYLNFNRTGRSNTRVASGDLSEGINPSGSSADSGGSSSTAPRTPSIEVETNSEADFWKELQATLLAIVGDAEDRSVVVNPQAGLAIVRGMPDELRTVEEFLRLAQQSVSRQVLIDAKIVEVELNQRYQAGVNWAGVFSVDGADVTLSQIGGGTIFTGIDASEIEGLGGDLDPGAGFSAVPGSLTSAFGGMFTAAIRGTDFTAFVELLRKQGDVRVLSSPRVSTVNNQRAVIKVGGDEFFVTKVESVTVAAGGVNASPAVQVDLTPFFSGIALDVTPQIDAEDNVTLHIHPTVSEVVQANKDFIVGGANFVLPLAFSSVQEADSVVRAKSGEIVVIGGLMKEGTTDRNASVPLLGDLPVVGRLFRHKRIEQIKRELVILLKPTIVREGADWSQALAESRRRVNRWSNATGSSTATPGRR